MSLNIRLSLLCVVLVAATVSAMSISSGTVQKVQDIRVVKDIRNFAAKHPGLRMQQLSKQPSNARTQSIRYSLGARIGGDGLVAQGTDTFAYPAANDVSLQLTYPENGTGAIVTYVEIIVSQDNDEGNAYVVAGGIGQRFISIIVEAKNTDYFSYKAQYFGSN